MLTARLLTNCSDTLRNIHTYARENITRTRAKTEGGLLFRGPPCISLLSDVVKNLDKIYYLIL